MEIIEYKGWPEAIQLANDTLEVVIPASIGPRVMRCGRPGGPNLFAELEADLGQMGGDTWRVYGGHRLWAAPEVDGRTNSPDNNPLTIREIEGGVHVSSGPNPADGLEVHIELRMEPDRARVYVTHRLVNFNAWPVRTAAWAITAMHPEGVALVPLPDRGLHGAGGFQASSSMHLWPYTDLTDPRWRFGRRAVAMHGTPAVITPQKMGFSVEQGWIACAVHGDLFVKRFDPIPGDYPDRGSMTEIYADGGVVEIETLGPWTEMAPGGTVEFSETWDVISGVKPPTDDGEDAAILKMIAQMD